MSAATRLLSDAAYISRDTLTDLTDHWGTIPTPTPGQVRSARLMVCGEAVDVAEARRFLSILGLEVDRG